MHLSLIIYNIVLFLIYSTLILYFNRHIYKEQELNPFLSPCKAMEGLKLLIIHPLT